MKVAQPLGKETKRSLSCNGKSNSGGQQAGQLGSSQQALKQKAIVEEIDASPRVTVQRRQIESYRNSARSNESIPVFSLTPSPSTNHPTVQIIRGYQRYVHEGYPHGKTENAK